MRLAFIADIHGNAVALDAVLEDIKQRNIDKLFILGDLSYRGPEPQRSIDIIKSLNVGVIKGNADEWIVRGVKDGEVPKNVLSMMNMEREWTLANLNNEDVEYLKDLPNELKLTFNQIKIHAFHATPINLFDAIQPDESSEVMKKNLITNDSDIFIYGHIHKPYVRFINGKCIINTGSVGLPFDGLDKASYALIDTKVNSFEASVVRVGYEVKEVVKQFEGSDYPNKELMVNILKNARI